jgi:hypothetical protein
VGPGPLDSRVINTSSGAGSDGILIMFDVGEVTQKLTRHDCRRPMYHACKLVHTKACRQPLPAVFADVSQRPAKEVSSVAAIGRHLRW